MPTAFDYLIEKINLAPFEIEPFKHVYIEDFFSPEHFEEIITEREINLGECSDDLQLFQLLFDRGYKVIDFPGCITDYKKYIELHSSGKTLKINETCENSGIVLRLEPKSPFLIELDSFLQSRKFNEAIARKFNLNLSDCNVDSGIQKYLDGYEISPHPDTKRKAATFMVNVNPHDQSEAFNHHTHYLTFKPQYKYIEEFWQSNEKADREWVPWEWCDTKRRQEKNNSIVLFAPHHGTLHAVKAEYDHLTSQRTQLYGNLWFQSCETTFSPSWEELQKKELEEPSGFVKKFRQKLGRTKHRLLSKLEVTDKNISKRDY